jgi:hypothetical protein
MFPLKTFPLNVHSPNNMSPNDVSPNGVSTGPNSPPQALGNSQGLMGPLVRLG